MNKFDKYLLPLIILVVIFIGLNTYKSNQSETDKLYAQLKCPDEYPDDFSDFGEKWKDMDRFSDNFFKNNPDASISDWAKERRRFYDIKGCTEAIERYESYDN